MLCYFPRTAVLAVAAGIVISSHAAFSGQAVISTPPPAATLTATSPSLTASQIVDEMLRHNQARADELKHYESVRHYAVEYKGFAHIAATLVVDATYDAATGKTFRIVSQSGNGLLLDKVLKRLIETEKDASRDKSSTALTPANYKFTLEGIDNLDGRPAYVLKVEPLVATKYLYRGKIWVDVADFGVAKIDAAPAKNPSFWISSTAINHQYARTEGFWLPAQNRSETKVRVGGRAVLTIDYGKYELEGEKTGTREEKTGTRE